MVEPVEPVVVVDDVEPVVVLDDVEPVPVVPEDEVSGLETPYVDPDRRV